MRSLGPEIVRAGASEEQLAGYLGSPLDPKFQCVSWRRRLGSPCTAFPHQTTSVTRSPAFPLISIQTAGTFLALEGSGREREEKGLGRHLFWTKTSAPARFFRSSSYTYTPTPPIINNHHTSTLTRTRRLSRLDAYVYLTPRKGVVVPSTWASRSSSSQSPQGQ